MKKVYILAIASCSVSLLLSSVYVSAQVSAIGVEQGMGTFANLITTFNTTIVKALGTLFMSGAVVAFFFGLAKFILGLREGKTDVITNGKQFMIWALVALFVMFSVYGIIRVVQGMFPGLENNTITIPEIRYGGGGSGGGAAGTGGSAAGTVYTCPNGTKYYDLSDYSVVCNNVNNNTTGGQKCYSEFPPFAEEPCN